MKNIITLIIVGILLISSVSIIGTSLEESVTIENIFIEFSKPIIREESIYSSILLNEANSYLIKQGMPVLPSTVHTFVYPEGTRIVDVTCSAGNMQQQTVTKHLEPSPIAVPVGDTFSETDKNDVYSFSDPYPENWYAYDIGSGLVDGTRSIIIKVEVFPVTYHPTSQSIEWVEDVSIDISYLSDEQTSSAEEEYEFLILTADVYAGLLQPLVDHKNSRGITTKVITLSDITNGVYFPVEGRDEQEQIKYFIKNAVDSWFVTNVMIVGGAEDFPARLTHVNLGGDQEIFPSDLYYADIYDEDNEFESWDTNENDVFAEFDWGGETDEIDFYPDVAIGRIACITNEQVTTVVNKIITYETEKAYTQHWFNNIVVIGGDTIPESYGDDSGTDEGELVNQFILDRMPGFIPDKIWDSNGRLSGRVVTGLDNIKAGIENGCGFLDFSGHGASWVWTTFPHNGDRQSLPTPTGRYTNGLIDDLTNGDMLPIVLNGGCSLGKYQEHENCNAWAFLANPNGGGIASFGATALGYVYIGEYVTEGLVEGLNIDIIESYRDGATTFGEMYVGGVLRYMPTDIGGWDYKTLMEWHAFGDPTLAVSEESTPPEKPSRPEGPSSGRTDESYEYTSLSTDVDGDELYYLFNWGDETYTWAGPYESGEQASASKQWTTSGDFEIKVKVKDEHGKMSPWSDPLSVSMPKKHYTPFSLFMEWLLQWFPSLEPLIPLI